MAISPTKEPTGAQYGVIDKNAKPGKTRTHQIPNGDGTATDYVFHPNRQVQMPAAHAAFFQRHENFIVYNPQGQVLPRIPYIHPAQVQDALQVRLKEGETVATFEELTREALLSRVYQFPKGDKFKPTSKKEDLVRFLNGLKPVADKVASAADMGENPEDVMSDGELDDLLPKQPLFSGAA